MSKDNTQGPAFPWVALVLIAGHLPQCHGAMEALALRALLHRLRHGTLPLHQLGQVILVHQGLCEAEREYLVGAAGVPIRFVGIRPGASLPQCQQVAVEHAGARHIIFAGTTTVPQDHWLETEVAQGIPAVRAA